ncbi:MAG TPA: DUF6036 family nucleotidyltransferase [Gemmataceae bacterium]|nr:DUF6036 family nucleotidyltransferase [Gemmataceae bacterium]
MVAQPKDLWKLVLERHEIDPADLAEAIEERTREGELDSRTRLPILDSVVALERYWGQKRHMAWMDTCPARQRIESILRQDWGEPGFPSLSRRVMDTTRPEQIWEFFRELGMHLHRNARLYIGRSAALILTGYLARVTEDIDVVDEVPAELRSEREFLDRLQERFDLGLAHFRSHCLPMGWQQRVHSLESLGYLQVYLVDVNDVFLSKLFSSRIKGHDDLRMLRPQLEKETVIRRWKRTTVSMLAAPPLRQRAADNWYILYGEVLPTGE